MSFDKKQSLVSLSNVGIHRHERWLIRNIDLTVHRGEIVTLIGPNGSGKTTAAKVALGLLTPDEGHVTKPSGLSIGYVPQKFNIDPTIPLTTQRLLTLARRHTMSEITNVLNLVGAQELLSTPVQNLSGGEFQRIMLARAMISKPDLLVLDEPTQGVDFNGELVLYDLIKTIRKETGCGILLVSHDLHMVMAETDTVLCLNGHVCCTGTPEAVASNPEYARLFGQRAVETLAVYRHNHDHVHLDDGRVQHADGSITDHCHQQDGHHANSDHPDPIKQKEGPRDHVG